MSDTNELNEAPEDVATTEEVEVTDEVETKEEATGSEDDSPMTPREEKEAALEAVLFVSGEPVSRDRLLSMFDEGERAEASEALDAVLERYRGAGPEADSGRGVMIDETAGGFRIVTKPQLNGWLRRFFNVTGANKLSMAALETLAIIAYRQPVTAPEIQELRGVSSSGVLKTLLEKRLVRIAGRKEVVGKPFLYTTNREFLVHFGLQTLKDLPPLEEFEDALGDGEVDAGPTVMDVTDDREELFLQEAAVLEEMETAALKARQAGTRVGPLMSDLDDDESAAETAGEEEE